MVKLGMRTFRFVSPDTLINVEKLVELFREGGWVEFDPSEERLDGDWDRDELLLRIMEITGGTDCELHNFQPLAVGTAVLSIIEGVAHDFKVHLRWVVGESSEFRAVADWLRDGNYFSIGDVAFSSLDVEDTEFFLDKYLGAMKSDGSNEIITSLEDGFGILEDFFLFCRKSIIGN